MNNKILKVIIGSKNPVKINATRSALSSLYPTLEIDCLGIHAPSLVSEQPMTEEETKKGAINRVAYCQQQHQADFYVAIEGGVDLFDHGPATFAYVVIANNSHQSIGRSAMLPLPNEVYSLLQQGEELGPVMDNMFNTVNIKQKGGAIGLLTNGKASRESDYNHALILAMAPFLNQALYNR